MRVVFCFARGRSSCFGAMCCQCCPSSSGRLLRLGPAEHARAAALLCDLRIDPRTLSRYRSCTVSLIWSRVISPTVFFFAKNGFSTFRAYSFPNFRIRCLSTKKKNLASSDFDRDYIKPTNRFGENWQLYCVWPPLHEHCVPLHSFRSSSFYQHFVIISMRILHVSLNVCLDISFSLDFPHSLKAPIYQTDFIC